MIKVTRLLATSYLALVTSLLGKSFELQLLQLLPNEEMSELVRLANWVSDTRNYAAYSSKTCIQKFKQLFPLNESI